MSTTTRRPVIQNDVEQDDGWEIIDVTGLADAAQIVGLDNHSWSSSDHPVTGAPKAADPEVRTSSFTWRVVPRQGDLEGSFEEVNDAAYPAAPSNTSTPTVAPTAGSSSSLAGTTEEGWGCQFLASSATSVPVSSTDGGRSPVPIMEDEASSSRVTSSIRGMVHSPTRRSDSASMRMAADGNAKHSPTTYSNDTWDLVIISQPKFRPVAPRSSRHSFFQLPILNLLFPGMLCLLTAHHMLCGSRHPHPHTFGSFPSFSSRHPCSESLCLSS